MEKFDYLVVGSGLYGAIFAHEAKAHGKSVLIVDKRPNIAGNIYTENVEGINVHKYGAHIFHTNNKKVWNYITQFAEFNRFTNSPVANYKGELYSLPFNMYTFNKMWGVVTPEEATAKIEEQRKEITHEPQNLEEQAISLVGRDIYGKLIKGYTEKQWGRDCKDLPPFIIKRLPVRLTFDNNYFNALYQGIPVGGYTKMIANLLDGIEVRLNTDYLENKAALDALADKVVYTGPIDAYFDYKLGTLEYRSVRFETETLDKPNFQGNAAVNYTDRETPWTRIIEHKWFEFGKNINVDYIIHGASQTSSRAFIEEPIETITTALTGTKNMLEFARVNNVKGFVYLSSMEVYGSPLNDLKIDEKHGTNLDTMKVRSCYPESKRMCESLCASYSSEFGVPAKVVRLTQTFGPGVKYDDGRVFAEFARCAIERRNIVLKTKGETRRSYLYTEDAVNAILTVLYNGIPGQAYNAANEETYCSIYEMAKMVAGRFGDNSVKVLVEETNPEKLGYAPVLYMNLDTTKLHNLGWKAKFNLESMYQNMIEDMKINQKRY